MREITFQELGIHRRKGIIGMDSTGRIHSINKIAQKILGLENKEQLNEQIFLEIFGKNLNPQDKINILKEKIISNENYNDFYKVKRFNNDDEFVWVDINFDPIIINNTTRGFTIMMSEVSEKDKPKY